MNLIAQETRPEESYRLIPLTRGQFAIVDAADYEWLSQWKWCVLWSKDTQSFYARRGFRENGKQKCVYMHRLILGLEHGDKRQADHKESGSTLDNRRNNLRIATGSQNSRNTRMHRDNKSGFKGVTEEKRRGGWYADIMVDGKNINIGCYATKEAAHEAYCATAKKVHGTFARFK